MLQTANQVPNNRFQNSPFWRVSYELPRPSRHRGPVRSLSFSVPSSPPRRSIVDSAFDDCFLVPPTPLPLARPPSTTAPCVERVFSEPLVVKSPSMQFPSTKSSPAKNPEIESSTNEQLPPVESLPPAASPVKRTWGPTIRKPHLQQSRYNGDLQKEKEYPRLPQLPPLYFASQKTTTSLGDQKRKPTAGTSSLRFNNKKEVSELYRRLVELHGWSKEEEEARWRKGLVTSKKSFVESELPELEKMGFSKVPTRQEMDDFHKELKQSRPYDTRKINQLLEDYDVHV